MREPHGLTPELRQRIEQASERALQQLKLEYPDWGKPSERLVARLAPKRRVRREPQFGDPVTDGEARVLVQLQRGVSRRAIPGLLGVSRAYVSQVVQALEAKGAWPG